MTHCQVCGANIKGDMKFCARCTIDRAHSQALKKNPHANSGGGNDPGSAACFVCGERLGPSVKKCGKCGSLRQDDAKMFKWYLQSAKDGDDCSQERLGYIYARGIGTERDYQKALAWFFKAAEQGNDDAKAQLGAMYEQSLGVGQDYQKAFALYREAAEAGNALGQARLADMYYQGIGTEKDHEKAFAYFQAAAAKGNDHSQAKLGDMYLFGLGVKADLRQALNFYRQAAEQGNAHAQAQLGGMYLYGVAVDRDYGQALAWNQKSAGQGNDIAQAHLGRMHEKGLGVDKDLPKALEFYKKSAAQGNALGQARLGEMYLNGSGVEQDLKKACAFFQRSAAQGNDLAQFRLATMYCDGNGVEQDLRKGFELLQSSAKQGRAKAQLMLGGMYRDGKGVPRDQRKAFSWIQKSARQGDAIAQYDLGRLYEQGWGVDRDLQKAREWYLRAAGKGFAAAQVCLGNIYKNGLGVGENIKEAKKWYIQAAEKGDEKAKSELLQMELEADPNKKFKSRMAASFKGDARAMAEVADMYLMGSGVERNEENALEWLKKAFDFGNVSVRGKLQQVEQSIAARGKAAVKGAEKTSPAAAPLRSAPKKKSAVAGKTPAPVRRVQKKKPRSARTSLFPFPVMALIALPLLIVVFNAIRKSGRPDDGSQAAAPEIAAVPRARTEWLVPAMLEAGPETLYEIKQERSLPKQKGKKPVKTAALEPAPISVEPVAAVLRREYRSLNEGEISAMLGAKNIFDAQRNPGGNFRHQYEIRNVAGLRLIFDRATGLVWMRQQNLVKMNLEKIKDWIASLNHVQYGGIGSWRLPTVEEAAALLQKNPGEEKIFLDVVFGKDDMAIWTGDSFSESRSWIVDFRNGLIDQAKNKNRLPALMVSSD